MKTSKSQAGKSGRKKRDLAAAPLTPAAEAQKPEQVLPQSAGGPAKKPAAGSSDGSRVMSAPRSEDGNPARTKTGKSGPNDKDSAAEPCKPAGEAQKPEQVLPTRAAVAAEIQASGPNSGQFTKGTSGNPSGRPKGSRNKETVALEEIMLDKAEAIIRKAGEMALAGDRLMIKVFLDRVLPVRKERAIRLELPPIRGAGDLPGVYTRLWGFVADGVLSAMEFRTFADVLEMHRNAFGTADLEARLEKLEAYADQR